MFRFNLWARGPFFHGGSTAGLENSPYPALPAHLANPASMLGLTSADRSISLASQAADKDKDSTAPITASSFPLFRPGDALPAGIYSPLHQQFLRAQLDLAQSQSRTSVGDDASSVHPSFILSSHPSAFVPAAKRAKLDTSSNMSGGEREDGEVVRGLRPGEDVASDRYSRPGSPNSPASRRSNSPDRTGSGLDLTLDTRPESTQSAGCRSPSPGAAGREDGGGAEHETGLVYCPVCRSRVDAEDAEEHLAREMHELALMYRRALRGSGDKENLQPPATASAKSRYETFMRIRGNRENRLGKLRHGPRRGKRFSEEGLFNGLDSNANPHSSLLDEETIDIMSCDDVAKNGSDDSGPDNRQQAATAANDALRCAGCKELYSKAAPTTSVICWHVYCATCWTTVDGESRCPQCEQAASAGDLRRVYLA